MHGYMSNPSAFLQYAFPLYTSSRLQIRLSFWFLLYSLYFAINDLELHEPLYYIALDCAVMLAVCVWHEFGHLVFSRWVGGNHWEWVLWPLGGMVAPSVPKRPWATFVGNIGGIAFNAIMILVVAGVAAALGGEFVVPRLFHVPVGLEMIIPAAPEWVNYAIDEAVLFCVGIIGINLFPCFWFDGGYIWQAALWPKFGQWSAMRITCMAGMILAVPAILLSLMMGWAGFVMMIFWVLVFSDCFNRRRALAEAGPGVMDEDDGGYNYMDTPEPVKRKRKKRWLRSAKKKAVQDQAEQKKIDAILAKVKDQGLHSLSYWEKRTLKRATDRQRRRDLANRL